MRNDIPSYQEPSLQTRTLIANGDKYYVPNYKPKPVILDKGRGARVWDLDGNEYIDFTTGISVTSLGHGDPELVDTLTRQAQKIWHASNIFYNQPALLLAAELIDSAPFAKRVFYCNSGAEANEAAIKLARKYSSLNNGADKREIITFEGGFHGRTLATVTATAQPKYHEGFEPLPGGFVYCPYNDPEAVTAAANERTCAILVEPIQGEGGVNPAKPGFLRHLRQLCDRYGALLICDEVQTGMGRSGKLFTYQWEDDLSPDVVTMAKAMGGGLPIGAMLVGDKAAEVLQPGSHGSTFGGNAIVCEVARTMLRRVRDEALLANVRRQGEAIIGRLHAINDELQIFSEIRGRGLLIGAQLSGQWQDKANDLSDRCQQHGALVLIAGPGVLRFLPPLNLSDEETATGMDRVAAALRAACAA